MNGHDTISRAVTAATFLEGPSEAERRERQLAALYELWRAVPGTAVDRLLQMLAERAANALDAHTCSLLLRERGGDTLTVAASFGLAQDVAESARLLVGERIAGRVAATGQPVLIVGNPSQHPLMAKGDGDARAMRHEEYRPDVASALCAPLLAGDGEVLGVLCLSRLVPAASFSEGDLRVFSLFAAQAGSVVAQVRVGADRARREQELAALGQVAEAIRARLPENVLLERLAEGVQEVIGFERCQVWRRDKMTGEAGGDSWTLAAGRGFRRGVHSLPAECLDLPERLKSLRGAPRELAVLAAEDPDVADFARALGVTRAVVAPLILRGDCAAIVLADVASGGSHGFSSERIETLDLFVGHVGVAIENARLFEEVAQAGREAADREREMARTANLAALGQMAATVAHELRNPLASIKGAAQFLLDDANDPALVRDFLTIVVDEVDGLSRLTTDLLTFARPPAPERFLCDLVAVVRSEADFLRSELEAGGVTLQETYAAPAWTSLDAGQVGRALRNLLLNAAQAMPEGGRLSLSVQPAANDAYELAVSDTGPGVPRAIQGRLWEPFFTTKARGTGLGLAQVKQVVEAHGGAIHVEDAPGGGARFVLRLPADKPADKPGQSSEKENE